MKKFIILALIVIFIAGCVPVDLSPRKAEPVKEAVNAEPDVAKEAPTEPTKEEVKEEEPAKEEPAKEEPVKEETKEEEPVTEVPEDLPETQAEPAKEPEEKKMNPIIQFKTTLGDFKAELFLDTMPVTAGNFKDLVEKKFYDGVIFHRVIPNFMVQGGDPDGTGMGGPGYKIKDEFTNNNRNERGTFSMANSGPNTGGSQFFINVKDNAFLDPKHPVFAKVTEGMDVVDKIVNTPRDSTDRPDKEVKMLEVSVLPSS